MQTFQCLLFVLKRSYICYYIICMTVSLMARVSLHIFHKINYIKSNLNINSIHHQEKCGGVRFQNYSNMDSKITMGFSWKLNEQLFSILKVSEYFCVNVHFHLTFFWDISYGITNSWNMIGFKLARDKLDG